MEAIRNLSKLANDLTKNGKLVVPGGLEIKGRLTVNGETKVRAKTYFYKQVVFKNQKKEVDGLILIMIMDIVVLIPFYVWHDSHLRGDVKMESNLKVNGNVGARRDLHPKVGLIVNGAGLAQGVETVGAEFADKSLRVHGTTSSMEM